MKIGNFVQIVTDIQDVLSYFANVESKDQMISKLDAIKKQAPEPFLDSIKSLQSSFDTVTEDTIETPSEGEIDNLFSSIENDKAVAEPNLSAETPEQRLGIKL